MKWQWPKWLVRKTNKPLLILLPSLLSPLIVSVSSPIIGNSNVRHIGHSAFSFKHIYALTGFRETGLIF